jgi:hypothetical protein
MLAASQAMILIYAAFGTLWLVSNLYAWIGGGWEGRWLSFTLIVAALVSPLLQANGSGHWANPQYGLFAIDLLVLIVFATVVARSQRYWPLWLMAFQSLTVMTHVVFMIDRTVLPVAYQAAVAFWSIPIQCTMAIGILMDNKESHNDGRRPSQNQ